MPSLLSLFRADMQERPLILITRVQHDSERFARLLHGEKAEIHILPFFEIQLLSPALVENVQDINTLLITSQHAIPFLKHHAVLKTKPCIVVGNYTKDCLLRAGFKNIVFCANSAAAMRDLLLERKHTEHLLYPRGNDISFDFKSALQSTPITLSELITYEVMHIAPDMQKLAATLADRAAIILPLFSVQTAEFVCESLANLGDGLFQKIIVVPMSTAIADAIQNYPWKKSVPSRSAGLQSVAKMVMLHIEP